MSRIFPSLDEILFFHFVSLTFLFLSVSTFPTSNILELKHFDFPFLTVLLMMSTQVSRSLGQFNGDVGNGIQLHTNDIRCSREITGCLNEVHAILNNSQLTFAQNEEQLDTLCRSVC